MAFNTGNSQLLSKLATGDQHGENSCYFEGLNAWYNDPFHPIKNPNGVIQMGLSENQLSFDLIEEWIRKHPTASICTHEGVNMFRDIANFQDYHGLPEFRNAVAKFMGRVRGGKVTFDPDRIVMAGGATGASEAIMFCLADPGDAFLVPTPYYPAFDRDLRWRTRVQLIPVNCKSSNNFQITREALEEAYKTAIESNIRVKGVIITNPSNPLGTTMDRHTQITLLSFINQKSIHLVCDEIYSATVFGNPAATATATAPDVDEHFLGISEIIESEEVKKYCNRDLVHIITSMSKDMGMPGFRIGILYSYNDAVVNCGRKMSSFGLVSTQTQYLIASILSDEEFVGKYLAMNSSRLAKRHDFFTKGLEEVGIKCLKSNARLFCWMDLRPLLSKDTFEAETLTWRVIVNEAKLNVSPGQSFHCTEPGWFRVCFANVDDDTLHVALTRIRKFVAQAITKVNHDDNDDGGGDDDQTGTAEAAKGMKMKKEKEWIRKKNLRLSFSSSVRGLSCDDSFKSPNLMSPHTPISQSQLLKASK